jgi:hypothetical protein
VDNEINDSATSSDVSSIDRKLNLSLIVPNVRASATVGEEKLKDDTTFAIEEDCHEQEERKEEKEECKTGIEDTNKEGKHNENQYIMKTFLKKSIHNLIMTTTKTPTTKSTGPERIYVPSPAKHTRSSSKKRRSSIIVIGAHSPYKK